MDAATESIAKAAAGLAPRASPAAQLPGRRHNCAISQSADRAMFIRASAQLRRRRNNLLVQFTGAEAWACGGDIGSNLSWRRGDHVWGQCEPRIGIRGLDRGWDWRRGGRNARPAGKAWPS